MEPPKSAFSARPESVDSPVPGKQQKMDINKLFDSAHAPELPAAKPEGSPAPASNVNSLFDSASQASPQGQEAPGVGMQTLDAAGRVLDYPGGFMRAGLAEAAGLASGQGSVVTPADLKNAAVGKGPNSEEYLRRLGVSEGGSLNFGNMKISQRDITGLALDIASDPLTALSKMVKAFPYLEKLINVPGKASEALGEAAYRSAFKKIDEKLAEKGGGSLSSALIEAGAPTGTSAQMAKKVDDMSNVMGKLRQGLYDKAAQKGVSIDTAFPLKRAEAVLENMRRDPGLRPAAEGLQELMDSYKGEGKVPIDLMSQWKTSLYDALPQAAFNGQGKLKGPAKQFKAALAADFREAIVGAGNKAEKGLGDSINAVNEKWGTLLNASGPLAGEAKSAGKLGAMIDGAVLAAGGLKGAAVKKSYDLATSTYAKTKVGKALIEAGKNDFANRLTRQAVKNLTPQPQPPSEIPEEQ